MELKTPHGKLLIAPETKKAEEVTSGGLILPTATNTNVERATVLYSDDENILAGFTVIYQKNDARLFTFEGKEFGNIEITKILAYYAN